MKKIICALLALLTLASALVFSTGAEENWWDNYYMRLYHDRANNAYSTHGDLRSWADEAIIIDTSDLSVVFRFYDDGSTAVYYTGKSAAYIDAYLNEHKLGHTWMVWDCILPDYLNEGLKMGFADLLIRSTFGPYTDEQLDEIDAVLPGDVVDRTPAAWNNGKSSYVRVPVLNYEDVPEGTTLTLIKTNYVEPPTPEEQSEIDRRRALFNAAMASDAVISLLKIDPKEKKNYPLSFFRIGYDLEKGTLKLLDKDLNELRLPTLLELGSSAYCYAFNFWTKKSDALNLASQNGWLTVALTKGGGESTTIEVGKVECINLGDPDAVTLSDYPETDLVLDSFFNFSLDGKSVGIEYTESGFAKLYVCKEDGTPINNYNDYMNGIMIFPFPVTEGIIDDSSEGWSEAIRKGIKKGKLNVFLRLRSSDDCYHACDYASLPVYILTDENIRIGFATVKPHASFKVNTSSVLLGDANADGKLNSRDVIAVMDHLLGGAPLLNAASVDMNADGRVNSRDVIIIMCFIADGGSTVSVSSACIVFGHRLTSDYATETVHNAYGDPPYCVKNTYLIVSCSNAGCGFIHKTLTDSKRIASCHG